MALLSTTIGAPCGAISGLIGGRVDAIMMRLGDLLLVLPLLVVAAALASSHSGDTVLIVALVLGLLGWPVNARQVRGVVLGLREQEFVEAARAMGAGTWRIVFRHLLPNATVRSSCRQRSTSPARSWSRRRCPSSASACRRRTPRWAS